MEKVLLEVIIPDVPLNNTVFVSKFYFWR